MKKVLLSSMLILLGLGVLGGMSNVIGPIAAWHSGRQGATEFQASNPESRLQVAGFADDVGLIARLQEKKLAPGETAPPSNIKYLPGTGELLMADPKSLPTPLEGAWDQFVKCAAKYRVYVTRDGDMNTVFERSATPDAQYDEALEFASRHAQAAIFPLYVYTSDVYCPIDYLGQGSAIALDYIRAGPATYILWLTVDHMVNTFKYFDVAVNRWEIKGEAFLPLGCRENRYCVGITPAIDGVRPLGDFTKLTIGDMPKVGDRVLGYGCSTFDWQERRSDGFHLDYADYCQPTTGVLLMSSNLESLKLIGGDLCTNQPATGGYSGSGTFFYSKGSPQDSIAVLGTLNSGAQGMLTCLWRPSPTLIEDAKKLFDQWQKRLNEPTPQPTKPQQPQTGSNKTEIASVPHWLNWDKMSKQEQVLWEKAYKANEAYEYVPKSGVRFWYKTESTLIQIVWNPSFSKALNDGRVGIRGHLQDWADLVAQWESAGIEVHP